MSEYTIRMKSFVTVIMIVILTGAVCVGFTGCVSHHVSITHPAPPDSGSVHILIYSDAGYANDGQKYVAAAMVTRHKEYPFTFALCAGDNIQIKPEVFGSRSMMNPWGDGGLDEAFELPFAPLIESGLRFYTVAGNHDHQGFRYHIERNYSDNKNVTGMNSGGFVCPDSDYVVTCDRDKGIKIILLDVATAFSNLNWSDEREAFLRGELAKNDNRWTILVFHYPLWSSGEDHGRDAALIELRKIILPILDTYPVDFVFSGHDHHAELFRYRGKNETRLAIVGNTARPHGINNEPDLPSVFRSDTRGFTELDIHGDTAELNFRSVDGSILFKDITRK
ncbi:MAG TPA: metallophosphoesterase [Spirochaetota bacterium]|nr:metallophosphoesterase [Spirochaetota bacterium]